MKEYQDLLQTICDTGTDKEPARDNMPATSSIFGYQLRVNLANGFPIVTTKKISFKNILVELCWFLRGQDNIKYMVDHNVNIWNEDAYSYYLKVLANTTKDSWYESTQDQDLDPNNPMSFELFIQKIIQDHEPKTWPRYNSSYKLGDTGVQYPVLWRKWQKIDIAELTQEELGDGSCRAQFAYRQVDQLSELITSLKLNPLSRRHIITAWDPANLTNMALNACHCFVQFNCRLLSTDARVDYALDATGLAQISVEDLNKHKVPNYYLDCHLYQRSGDAFLGVPYNISSYSLLTELLCKLLNFAPGEFIHSFGDVHLYHDHQDQVNLQLTRNCLELPKLEFSSTFLTCCELLQELTKADEFTFKAIQLLETFEPGDASLLNYKSYDAIKAKLSTGLV